MFRLLILNPAPGAPTHFTLAGGPLGLGRDPGNELVLEQPSVSRKHAVLQQEAGAWWVEDLGGSNGTRLNGQRIQKAWLKPGDRLRIGQVELLFEAITRTTRSAPPPTLPQGLPPSVPPPPLPPPSLPAAAAPPPLPDAGPGRKKTSRLGLWIGLSAAVVLLLTSAWLLRDRLLPRSGRPPFLAFREQAGLDPRAAFAEVEASSKLAEINQALWPTVEPEVGWTYFFRTCLVTPGPRRGKRQAVLFYHPWSDTALVTEWVHPNQLIDMEMMPGEGLREGLPPYGGALGWTRLGAYAPPAVGMVTAETLRAFQKAFAAETNLQRAFPWLGSTQAREACRVACSLQFAQVVQSLATFSAAYDQPARLAFIRVLAQGEAALSEARGTPLDSAKALRALPPQAWSGFQPTAFVDTQARVLVMAHHRESPDLFLGVVFRREGAELQPERLDLLSFSACYGALK